MTKGIDTQQETATAIAERQGSAVPGKPGPAPDLEAQRKLVGRILCKLLTNADHKALVRQVLREGLGPDIVAAVGITAIARVRELAVSRRKCHACKGERGHPRKVTTEAVVEVDGENARTETRKEVKTLWLECKRCDGTGLEALHLEAAEKLSATLLEGGRRIAELQAYVRQLEVPGKMTIRATADLAGLIAMLQPDEVKQLLAVLQKRANDDDVLEAEWRQLEDPLGTGDPIRTS